MIQRILKRMGIFFAVFGPATITAISDNDGAGVATFSLAGANFGYSSLFILFLVAILLAITQEMGARIAIVTQKGLGDFIRERYGIRTAVFVFFGLAVANLGSIIANFSAFKAAAGLFDIPLIPLMICILLLSFLFVAKGNYNTNQNIFLLGVFLYISYIISAFRSQPDWGLVIKSTLIPTSGMLNKEFIIGSIAILGTTITPWGQFFINSYVNDKKIPLEKLRYTQIEAYFGAFLTAFFSAMMIIATAATLYVNKIPLISGEDAARAIEPFAGHLASILFAVGLFNAALMGIIIISLSTAYAFSELFGFMGSLDVPFERGKLFYILFIFQLVVGSLIALIPHISLFKIVFFTQTLNGILLPLIFFFLLKITNDKSLMGKNTNSKVYNYIAIGSSIIIVIASLFAIISSIIGN